MAGLLQNLFLCPVCGKQLDNSNKMLPCQHSFCKPCLQNISLTSQRLRCPECKYLVTTQLDDLPPNMMILKITEAMQKPTARKTNQHEIEGPERENVLALEGPESNNKTKTPITPNFSTNQVIATQSNKRGNFKRTDSRIETFDQVKTNEEATNSKKAERSSTGKIFCWHCKTSKTEENYFNKDDRDYCTKCYEQLFSNECAKCDKVIGIYIKAVTFKDQPYHETCFICEKCKKRPVGGVCQRNDDVYCKKCYEVTFAKICSFCTNIIKCGEKYFELHDQPVHSHCFCCYSCKKAIGQQSFFEKDDRIYCSVCHDEKFREWCCKCNKVINKTLITYDNESWCDICFVCSACKTSLSDDKQKCYPKDEELYCMNCYLQHFAHKCQACKKPCGVNGKSSYSIEDCHWHDKCFVCVTCKNSLIDKGAIPSGKDIFCSGCYWSKET